MLLHYLKKSKCNFNEAVLLDHFTFRSYLAAQPLWMSGCPQLSRRNSSGCQSVWWATDLHAVGRIMLCSLKGQCVIFHHHWAHLCTGVYTKIKRLRSPTCSSFDHLHRSAPDQVSYMKGGRDTCTNVHPWPVLLCKQEDREGLESTDRGRVMWSSEMKEHPWRFTKIAYWHFRLNVLHESFVTSPFPPSWVSVSLNWTRWKLVKILLPNTCLCLLLFVCKCLFISMSNSSLLIHHLTYTGQSLFLCNI